MERKSPYSSPSNPNGLASPCSSLNDIKNGANKSGLGPESEGFVVDGAQRSNSGRSIDEVAFKRVRSGSEDVVAKRLKPENYDEQVKVNVDVDVDGTASGNDSIDSITPTFRIPGVSSSATAIRKPLIFQLESTPPPPSLPQARFFTSPAARASTSSTSNIIVIPDSPVNDITEQNRQRALAKIEKRKLAAAQAARDSERAEKDKFGTSGLEAYGLFARQPPMAKAGPSHTFESIVEERDPKNYVVNENCSEEQRRVLDAVRTGRNVFFTGSAGVGKSFLLAEVVALLDSMKKKHHVCATTGIAALNIKGKTIHSWSGMGLGQGSIEDVYKFTSTNKTTMKRWTEETDVLIIDEISMLGGEFFTKLNVMGKVIRHNDLPFGGIQLVVCGDFFQLPPVPDSHPKCIKCGEEGAITLNAKESTLPYLGRPGGLPHFKILQCKNTDCKLESRSRRFVFETESWSECDFFIVELTKVFRQSDAEFIGILEQLRRGRCLPTHLKYFAACGSALGPKNLIKPTNLYPKNDAVARMNADEFAKLKEKPYAFKAVDEFRGENAQKFYGKRIKDFPAIKSLALKVGCQVILLANIDMSSGLVNGSRGIIVGFKPSKDAIAELGGTTAGGSDTSGKGKMKKNSSGRNSAEWKQNAAREYIKNQNEDLVPEVFFANGVTRLIAPHTWTNDINKLTSVGTTQIPLNLGWALTIHKSQGQSLDAVAVRLDQSFEVGQCYVALSRARTPEGMVVTGMNVSMVKSDTSVLAFYENMKLSKNYFDVEPLHVHPGSYLPLDHPGLRNRQDRPIPVKCPRGTCLIPPSAPSNLNNPSRGSQASKGEETGMDYEPYSPQRVNDNVKPFLPTFSSSFDTTPPVCSSSEKKPTTTPAVWHDLLRQAAIAFAESSDTKDHQGLIDQFTEQSRFVVESVLNSVSKGRAVQMEEDEEEAEKKPILSRSNLNGNGKGKGKGKEIEVIDLLDTDDDDEEEEDGDEEAEKAMRESWKEDQKGFNAY